MLKIFTTQLQGLFTKIHDKELLSIEDGARLLAQAAIGEGIIYIHGFAEMEAVTLEATIGQEPMISAARLIDDTKQMAEVSPVDRVLLVTRFSTDEDAIELAQTLTTKGIEVVAISALVPNSEGPSLDKIVDIYIDSKLGKPLIPDDDGNRFGFPSIITALYAYYGLAFSIKEMVEEYLEEEEEE
ncbi:DUF2529 domain-containing protein [Bacillus luteolus]|uniref:DUF2529 domain-containing protein n=1 Tax=Litchfieldia luteola TaxID=682179 RepID=A0ABR9QGY4_9BACI|nr:DUF2529 domain-containing protein [Cytobacillus luteolus]MBE4907742.1 DUF2529 domain-containing protein [Cytobacillus luteolus]MBP1944090.1 putative phosphosugar-binding protein [Cytobacillus luteolus]